MKKMNRNQFLDYLKPRSREFHKGNAGHVLIVGGDEGYGGAVQMVAEAALRVGAGLVSVVTKIPVLYRPEVMVHPSEALERLMTRATVIVLGPGLGMSNWGRDLYTRVLTSDKPLLVDADGLNLLSEQPKRRENWVLTPHPGEAARLLRVSSVQHDRIASVKQLQQTYGGVAVLKGAGSLIASADEVAMCEAGNPGMATGGMGDVLSGVIAGLIAQGLPLAVAAQLGVLVHATAGDLAAKEGERGMIATDLMPYLRELVNNV